jgi:hypothetical protein
MQRERIAAGLSTPCTAKIPHIVGWRVEERRVMPP